MDLRSDTLRNRAGKDAPQSFQTPAQFSAMALKRAVTRPQTWAQTRSRFSCIAVTSPKNWLRPLKSSLCRDEFLGMARGRYAEQFVGRGRSVPEVLVEVGAARDECEEATHAPRDLFMGGQGHDQVDHFFARRRRRVLLRVRARASPPESPRAYAWHR